MKQLTETTLLPISLVITIIGGVFWLTSIYNTTQSNAASIASIENKQERYIETVSEIRVELGKIKGMLEKKSK